ncbi:helix-turn-helix domain-containing protein [Rothia kristinae]
MSPGTFNRRVNGKTAFDVEELERLATFLDVPYSQLVEVTPR